jgi:hypothetical protein
MQSERDAGFTVFSAVAAVMTIVFAVSFWRLGHHSLSALARWLFVWVWAIASPVFSATQLRRHVSAPGTTLSSDAVDAMLRTAWQVLMAGCLTSLGVLSLLGEYAR